MTPVAHVHLEVANMDTPITLGMILYMFKQVMGWSTVEIHAYIAHLRRQLRDKSVHPVAKLRLIYAQKPEDATQIAS